MSATNPFANGGAPKPPKPAPSNPFAQGGVPGAHPKAPPKPSFLAKPDLSVSHTSTVPTTLSPTAPAVPAVPAPAVPAVPAPSSPVSPVSPGAANPFKIPEVACVPPPVSAAVTVPVNAAPVPPPLPSAPAPPPLPPKHVHAAPAMAAAVPATPPFSLPPVPAPVPVAVPLVPPVRESRTQSEPPVPPPLPPLISPALGGSSVHSESAVDEPATPGVAPPPVPLSVPPAASLPVSLPVNAFSAKVVAPTPVEVPLDWDFVPSKSSIPPPQTSPKGVDPFASHVDVFSFAPQSSASSAPPVPPEAPVVPVPPVQFVAPSQPAVPVQFAPVAVPVSVAPPTQRAVTTPAAVDPFASLVPPLAQRPPATQPALTMPVLLPVPTQPLTQPQSALTQELPPLLPDTDDDPYEIHMNRPAVSNIAPFSAQLVIAAKKDDDPFAATAIDPFAASDVDAFSSSFGAAFDPFGPAPTAAPPAPSASLFATQSDLAIFESKQTKTPAKGNTAPFDGFAAVKHTPPGGLDIFSPTSKDQRVALKTQQPTQPTQAPPIAHTQAFDLFDQPIDVFAAPAPAHNTFLQPPPAVPASRPTTQTHNALAQPDPFAIDFEDSFPSSHNTFTQPLTSSTHAQPLTQNLLEDEDEDLNAWAQKHSLHGEAEDPMRQLRRVYQLSESHHDSDMDMEDDVDAYESKYLQRKPVGAPNQPPLSGKRSPNESSNTLTGGIPPNELWDGQIYTRLSTKSLVTKDWHDTYYVIKGSTLFLYKNKLDFQRGTQNFKKKIPITHNLRVLQIKAKEYKGLGPVYNFMLEEIMDYGPSNVGKFGSTYRPTIEELWKRIRQLILKKREERAQAQRYG